MNLTFEVVHDTVFKLYRKIGDSAPSGMSASGTYNSTNQTVNITTSNWYITYGTTFKVTTPTPAVMFGYITTQVSGTPAGLGVYNVVFYGASNSSQGPLPLNNAVVTMDTTQVGVPIGFNTNESTFSSWWSGTWLPGYDVDNNSTPRTNHYMYYDTLPPFAADNPVPVTYRLMIQSSGTAASNFYLNRSIGYSGQQLYEVGISQVMLTETYSQ
jgi:hypothetical protein